MGQKERYKLPTASFIVFKRDNKVLLHLRKNSGFMDGYFGLVSGHLEEGESMTETALREVEEEAGVKVTKENISFAHIMHLNKDGQNGKEYFNFFFLCQNWVGEVKNMEPEKCGALEWFSLSELPDNVIPYIKFALECIRDGKVYSELGF